MAHSQAPAACPPPERAVTAAHLAKGSPSRVLQQASAPGVRSPSQQRKRAHDNQTSPGASPNRTVAPQAASQVPAASARPVTPTGPSASGSPSRALSYASPRVRSSPHQQRRMDSIPHAVAKTPPAAGPGRVIRSPPQKQRRINQGKVPPSPAKSPSAAQSRDQRVPTAACVPHSPSLVTSQP